MWQHTTLAGERMAVNKSCCSMLFTTSSMINYEVLASRGVIISPDSVKSELWLLGILRSKELIQII